MKKSMIAMAVAAMCAFSLTSCDDPIFDDLIGHIDLTTSNPVNGMPGLTQAYDAGVALNFKSGMCNVEIDSLLIEEGEYAGTYEIHAGTVFVGSTQELISNNIADITFPLCGINLRDTVVGSYDISLPINDFSFVEYLDTTDVNSLITSGLALGENLGNVFAVAVTDSAFYLGYSGTINITTYGKDLQRVEGTVNNVEAVYITLEQMEFLVNLPEEQRNNFNLTAYLPHITFNGSISCTRANIDTVIEALDAQSSK